MINDSLQTRKKEYQLHFHKNSRDCFIWLKHPGKKVILSMSNECNYAC
jgi:hypothetical protein